LKDGKDEFLYELSEEISELVSRNTLIGDPILFFENIILIPFFEMVAILGEGHTAVNLDYSGSGVAILPKAFLILKDGKSEVLLLNKKISTMGVTEKILDVTF